MRKGYQAGNQDSVVDVGERFDKMVNSQDTNKKGTILKYILISTVILGFVLFYLFFSLNLIQNTKSSIANYQLVGRRSAMIRYSRLVLTEYLLSPTNQYQGQGSVVTLCQDAIQ